MTLDDLVSEWQIELEILKDKLYDLGDESHSLKYNLLSTEALRLSMCINDLYKQQTGKK